MLKRLALFITALIMAVLLAACGDAPGSDSIPADIGEGVILYSVVVWRILQIA